MRTDNAPRRQIDGLPGTASKTGVIKAYVLPTAAGGGDRSAKACAITWGYANGIFAATAQANPGRGGVERVSSIDCEIAVSDQVLRGGRRRKSDGGSDQRNLQDA
jgi:hypothetical protein